MEKKVDWRDDLGIMIVLFLYFCIQIGFFVCNFGLLIFQFCFVDLCKRSYYFGLKKKITIFIDERIEIQKGKVIVCGQEKNIFIMFWDLVFFLIYGSFFQRLFIIRGSESSKEVQLWGFCF